MKYIMYLIIKTKVVSFILSSTTSKYFLKLYCLDHRINLKVFEIYYLTDNVVYKYFIFIGLILINDIVK